ncbi:13733_t:CDS:2 [Cetraspora pellucida]|uniref:13733_t:CDS:1 n=1 Tax=Cetraspora pellucida TaxID=1433469 RepID=A0ACA9P0B6_9GLOM|nr:13733_t:CDS:2 [Cetraspora pellucida]
MQQKKAEIAYFAFASYFFINVNSSKEYVYSSDKGSNNNFMEFDNSDEINLIIEQLYSASTDGDEKSNKKSGEEPDEEPGKKSDKKSDDESGKKIDKKKNSQCN